MNTMSSANQLASASSFSGTRREFGRTWLMGIAREPQQLIAVARARINRSCYRLGATSDEWPEVFDCSGFVKWLFGQWGVELPRLAYQQHRLGRSVTLADGRSLDLLFASRIGGRWTPDPDGLVGHVGVLTDVGTVLQARQGVGIEECAVEHFLRRRTFRGMRRLMELPSR